MKIAQFADSYKPYISGVTVSIETLVHELEKKGNQVKIFAPSYPGHHEKGPKIFRLPSLPTRYPNFRIAIPFYPKILKELANVDIIHSHSPYQTGRMGMRLAKYLKIPYVYTFHTLFEEYIHYIPLLPKEFKKPIISAMIRNFCNQCSAIIVPTPKIKDYLLSKKVNKPIEVIPTGIKTDLISCADGALMRKFYEIEKDEVLLVYVGRLTEEKNIPFLLRSVARVLKKNKKIKFLIAATGPKEGHYRVQAENLGISKQTIFAGQIKSPEIFNYYAAGDIFVFASTTETQGLVIAEAKAAGLPTVAVDAQGINDVLIDGQDGFLVPQDENIFADKVLHLIKNKPLRHKMAKIAGKNAQKLSAHHMANSILKIYKYLIK
ncbi:MAG: glycosyltransferase [bacterium]